MLRKNKALTLIELLIVTAVLFIISLGIYTTFNNGIKIWRALAADMPQEDLYVLFDKFGSDVRNSLRLKNINFYGENDKISFAAIVDSERLAGYTTGSVNYFYDADTGTVAREERDFSQIYTAQKGAVRSFSKNIKSLRFRYYSYEPSVKKHVWQSEWLRKYPPLAVCIEVEIEQSGAKFKFAKTIDIPVSG